MTPQPKQGRLLALGDIHGCLTALETLLAMVEPGDGDVIVSLGDYVDRGPDSRGVMDCLIDLFEARRLLPLRGNHELMMLRARDSMVDERMWRYYGGLAALQSYGKDQRPGLLRDVPDRHWRFLAGDCRDWFETDQFIFAHTAIDPQLPMDQQSEDDLFWRSLTDRGPHVSGKLVVCGHTVQASGLPRNFGHLICIDTGAFAGGWLTALDVITLHYWQANQLGETQTGVILPRSSTLDSADAGQA